MPQPILAVGVDPAKRLHRAVAVLFPDQVLGIRMLYPHAREAGLFGAPDGRTSINFRVLYQLIKA